MNIRFTPRALTDVSHILVFLSGVHEDLPGKFRAALAGHLAGLEVNPTRWAPKGEGNIRAGRLVLSRRLRYYVFYDGGKNQPIRILRIISQQAAATEWPD